METLGNYAYIAIKKHFKKIIKHEVGVLENQNTEELHQMRVGMRRLRSSLDCYALSLVLPSLCCVSKISNLAAVLGELRDLDIMDQYIADYIRKIPPCEAKQLKKIVRKIKHKRYIAFKKIEELLSSSFYSKFKKAFQQWLKSPKYSSFGRLEIKDILPELLIPKLSNFFLYPTWYLPDINFEDLKKSGDYLNSLHSLRKEAKKLRYILELFTEISNDAINSYIQEVVQIQEILGAIQDDFILRKFLAQNLGEEIFELTPNLNQILQLHSLQNWQLWQVQAAKFRSRTFRQDFYMLLLENPLN